jgi:flagella basal body P-ring formation protein FlgA
MRRALALALVFAALPLAAGAASATETPAAVVRLLPTASLHEDDVVLGDVATIDGDAALAARLRGLRISAAPALGATQSLDGESVRRRVRLPAGLAGRVSVVVPARVVWTRPAQVVTGMSLVDAARREALDRLARRAPARGAEEPPALAPLTVPADVRVPAADVTLRVRVDDAPAGSAFIGTTVTVLAGGREAHTAAISFRVTRYRPVVVAATAVQARSALGPNDLRVEPRPASEVPLDALTEVRDAAELEAMQTLRPGDVVTARAVQARVLVRRGEIVTLVLEGPSFRITTQGVAGQDARRGDTVRVVNASSKREVLGRVEGAAVVRVPFAVLRGER